MKLFKFKKELKKLEEQYDDLEQCNKNVKHTTKTNCINCGAPLHSDKCEYCGTEYTVDEFGQINEYKVKLNILGEEKQFYISNIEKHNICGEAYRNVEGNLVINKVADKLKINLIEM